MGRDLSVHPLFRMIFAFQSTLPAWGETFIVYYSVNIRSTISIHSPRMGRDTDASLLVACMLTNFNPLSPHGERRAVSTIAHQILDISIHSPRMGRDGCTRPPVPYSEHFNPLSPHGERPRRTRRTCRRRLFQSTLPAWGETA